MSRKTITQLWLCLLCLLPLQAMAQTLEWWIDDHYDQLTTTSIAATDAEQELSLDLRDNTKFPFGFHKLYMRVIINGKPSAIYSSGFLKLSAGKATKLEYWIDDDQAHSTTITGEVSNDGSTYQFLDDLDLGNVTPGHHRLYYRAISNSGITSSAISSTPIIVKSKYYVENAEELTVREQAYWFDDDEPVVEYIARPKNDVKQSYAFDTRKLSDGQHTLHIQYGNSAGYWNGPLDIAFTKTKVNDPVIVANASVEKGVVTMRFSTVPNGFMYTFVRQYPSGKNVKVNDITNTEYPAALQATDTPAPGTYNYYVIGKYTDADGNTQIVRSGDISITVEEAAETVKRGRIHGAMKINGKAITNEWFTGRFDVYVNGEKATESNYRYPFHKEKYGHFIIDDVPYGTELSIGVGFHDGGVSSKLVTLTVDENTSNNTYFFDCTEEGEDGFLSDNDDYDILMWNKIHLTPNGWEMGVINRSEYRTWSGNIIVKVMSKEAYEMFERQKNGELSSTYFLIHPDAVSYEPSFITSANTHVNFGKKEFKTLVLDVIDLPKRNKSEDYLVCVYSQKDGEEQLKEIGSNPVTVEFNPYEMEVAAVNGFKTYMKGYAEVMKLFKAFSAWGDPFKLAWESVTDKSFELWLKNLEDGHTDFGELIQDEDDVAFRSTGLLLNVFFSDMDKAVKKYTDSFKETTTYRLHGKIQEFYNEIKDVMGVVQASQADDSHKFFELAKQVLKFSKKLNNHKIYDPAFEVYKTYFEVGDAMASAVERLANAYAATYVWERLVSGGGVYKIKVRKYTTDNSIEYFRGEDVSSQIKSIDIVLTTPAQSGFKVNSTTYEKVCDPDGITIKNVEFPGKYNTSYTSTEAWMAITWTNKRVTYIPLLNSDFVKLKNFSQTSKDPLTMTVELQSETYWDLNSIANKLTFVKP